MENKNTKEMILKAAAKVIRVAGSHQMTLEAVAKEAGVSKGGLLYHFPSKEALLAELIEFGVDVFNDALTRRIAGGMKWMDAYVDASFAAGDFDDIGASMQAALAENPELIKKFREHYRSWYQKAFDEAGFGAQMALLVLDGLFLHQQFGIEAGIDLEKIKSSLPELWKS